MKKIFVELFGKHSFAAFYRKKPALVNIVSVALECWHIFLSIAFVTGRAIVLVLLALFFIGRIDRKFLADDISKIDVCFHITHLLNLSIIHLVSIHIFRAGLSPHCVSTGCVGC